MAHLRILAYFLLVIEVVYASLMEERPQVTIKQGTLRGIKEEATKGKEFYSFKAIPYAKPPLGDLRFKDPVPGDPWKGIRHADRDPEYCLQVTVMDSYLATDPNPQGSEDCLYLNVYTSNFKSDGQLPVMVYFPGGAFIRGGIKDYQPYSLLNEDVVIVVVQSRLSVFGYLEVADTPIKGNYGLKDGIEALKWIQENIKHFGGDPGRVTTFGHSSGGVYSNILTLSPKAKGLLHGAIMQSGFAFSPLIKKTDQAMLKKFLNKTSCSELENALECLQKLDAESLYGTFFESMTGLLGMAMVNPTIDGDVLPDEPINMLRDKRYNPVNIMAGCARDDGGYGSLMMMPPVGSAEGTMMAVTAMAMMQFGLSSQEAKHIHSIYFSEVNNWNSWNQFFNDIMCEVPIALLSHIENEDQQFKTYLYSLDHRGQYSYTDFIQQDVEEKKDWIIHGDDLFYLFAKGPIYSKPLEREDDLKMRDLYLKLWTNFARTGNPTPDDSLGFRWEPASVNNRHRLSITLNPRMKQENRAEVIDFWLSLPVDFIYPLFKKEDENHSQPSSKEEL